MRTGKNETDLDFAREFSRPFEGRVYIHPLMPKAFYALLLVLIGSSHFAALCVESRIRSRQRSKTENPSTPSQRLHQYLNT